MNFTEWCKDYGPAKDYCLLDELEEILKAENVLKKAIAADDIETYLTDKGPVQMSMYEFLEKRAIEAQIFGDKSEKMVETLFYSPDAMTTFKNTMKLVWVLISKRSNFVGPFATSRKGCHLSDEERYKDIEEAIEEEKSNKGESSLENVLKRFSKAAFSIGNYTKLPKYPTRKKKEFEDEGKQTLNQAKGCNNVRWDWFFKKNPGEAVPRYINDQFAAFLMYFKKDANYEEWKKVAMLNADGVEDAYKAAADAYCSVMSEDLKGSRNRLKRIELVTNYLDEVSAAIELRGNAIVQKACKKTTK